MPALGLQLGLEQRRNIGGSTQPAFVAAPGQIIQVLPGLIPGAASAGSGRIVTGLVLNPQASLIPGLAIGLAAVTITVSATLFVGAAQGGTASTAVGAVLVATPSLVLPSGTGTANFSGLIVTPVATLIPGVATGGTAGSFAGVVIPATASLLAGTASIANLGKPVGLLLAITVSSGGPPPPVDPPPVVLTGQPLGGFLLLLTHPS